MRRRAFLSLFLAITGLVAVVLLLSPVSSSAQIPTFTPPPTFTPLPTPTPTPAPPRRVAVLTVSTWGVDNGACGVNCQYSEYWSRPLSGAYDLYENACVSFSLVHAAMINVADNHPRRSRYRYFRVNAVPVVTNPGNITAYLDVGWFAGNAYCWYGQGVWGTATSGGYGKLSCYDQSRLFDNPYDASCVNGSFFVYTNTSVRCLPERIKDFLFQFDWDLGAGCLYNSCGGRIESAAVLTLYVCAGPLTPTLRSGCYCEGPGTCYWCPRFQRFEVRGTNPPANGIVQVSDWSGVTLETFDYGRELLSFRAFTQTRRVTLTQPGYWFIDVFAGCPLPWTRGDLGYTSSASFDIVCPYGGYLDARYAPSPTTRLVCTIPAASYAVTVFPPLVGPQELVYPGPYTGFISLTSIFVISNSYAVSEVWVLSRTTVPPTGLPTITVPIITVPLSTNCFTVPPQLFVDIFDVDQVVVCLELVGFRFSEDLPWGDALLDVLVLGVSAIMVFAGIRALRE